MLFFYKGDIVVFRIEFMRNGKTDRVMRYDNLRLPSINISINR